MGTKLAPILITKPLSVDDLKGKRLAVDTFNILYQFLTTIRQYDGTPLMDSQGRVTSHLSGLFFRTTNLMKSGMDLVFVFDGKPPDLKKSERDRRKTLKLEAQRKYEQASEKQDIEQMKKFAARTVRITTEILDETKILLQYLGMPIIQAPAEGEAQAAYLAKNGDCYAVVSQDTDGLLFGSPRIIRNLSMASKKKDEIEAINLAENLNNLRIDHDQLIVLSMLCGTDFNIGGVKGIGPKKGLELLHRFGKKFDELFREVGWQNFFDNSWEEVFDTISNMPVTKEYNLKPGRLDVSKINDFLVKEHDFSQERVDEVLRDITQQKNQKGLHEFF